MTIERCDKAYMKSEKILYYDVAAEYGGAISVLNAFYNKALEEYNIKNYFVISKANLISQKNIKIIRLAWVKRSWFHRLYCDWFYMPKIVKKIKPDRVISLQNIGIARCDSKQTVYVQNALPFAEHRFGLLEDPFLWIYQNLIGKLTFCSLKKVDSIIVQNKWMQEAIIEKTGISKDLIEVREFKVEAEKNKERIYAQKTIFFYPATPIKFKNHKVIIDACKILQKRKSNYEIVFTLDPNKKGLSKKYAKQAKKFNLPIRFVGFLDTKQMVEYYRKSVLLFPSYIETVGLPLLEAKEYGANIIVADCKYSRNNLEGYKNVNYFKESDSIGLARYMENLIN